MFDRKVSGERIRSLRLAFGAKQSELAQMLHITPTQISDIENGKSTSSIERLWMIADFFQVSIDYIVGRSDDPTRR